MIVKKGQTDVNVYFKIQAGLTVTDFDTQYTRSGSSASTKADVTLLGGAGNSHVDNAGIYVDETTSPGLFRLCVPDASVATGVDEVEVTLLYASGLQETVRITLIDNTSKDVYDRLGVPAGASISADIQVIDDFIDTEVSAIKTNTDLLPSNFATVNSKLDTIDDFIDTEVSAIKTKTDQLTFSVSNQVDSNVKSMATDVITSSTIATSAITEIQAGLSTLTQAQVNAEVVDVIRVDTLPELSGVPSATAPLSQQIQLGFMALRNKNTTSTTQNKIHNDAETPIATAPVSDNGSIFTKGEFV